MKLLINSCLEMGADPSLGFILASSFLHCQCPATNMYLTNETGQQHGRTGLRAQSRGWKNKKVWKGITLSFLCRGT